MPPVKSGLSVTNIVGRMTGLDSLDGWGVLVAYDESALNKLLAARHEALPSHLTTIENLEAVVPELSQAPRTRSSTETPSSALSARTGLVHLFFSVEGWYTEPGAAEAKFDDGVFLDVTAKMVTTTGRLGKSRCDAAIDLSSPLVEMVGRDHAPLFALADVATALTDHISSVGLSYRLATLQNADPTGSVTLKPKEFVMTAVEAKDGNPGALLIWISVEGARSGGTLPSEDGSESLVFARKVNDLCNVNPIPKGANACVVISQEVCGTLFVKPQIEKLKYSGIKFLRNSLPPGKKDASKVPKTGLSFEATPPSRQVKLDEINSGDPSGRDHIDAVSFNMDWNSCKFFIDKSSSYTYLEYVVGGVNQHREFVIPYQQLGTVVPGFLLRKTERRDGKAKFTFKAKGDGVWKAAGDESFSVSFALPANFTVDVEPDTTSGLEEYFLRLTDEKLGSVEDLATAVPDVTVDLGSIQLFLATNLLLPGEHIFKLKSVPENLYIPHDVYLLGEI